MIKAKQKLTTVFVAFCTLVMTVLLACTALFTMPTNTIAHAADTVVATFEFGANGSATHKDASTDKATYSETNNDYTLSITDGSKMYPSSYDAKGNSCIKLGSSSAAGKFTFIVAEEVDKVIIYVAGYKANAAKITVNGSSYTINSVSNNGAYDGIEVDTTSTKTVSFTTVSGGYRAMMNKIEFVVAGSAPGCDHKDTNIVWGEWNNIDWKHSREGACECGETVTENGDCVLTETNVSNEDGTHNITRSCSVCGYGETNNNIACTFEKVLNDTTLTYTCKYCSYSYTEEANMYTVSYSVPTGVAPIESVEKVDSTTIQLPTLNDYQEYTFIGWTEEEITPDDKKDTAPKYWKAGGNFTVTGDVTLYALYTFNEGETEEVWNLVTDVSTLAVDKQIVIVASESNYALSTTQNSNNRGQASVTKSENTVTFGDDVQIITLEAGTVDGTYAFNTGSGYLYAASSGSNHLKTQTTNNENGSWKIEITSDGVATIKAQGEYTRNWLRYNSTSSLFSCYGSGQKDISIYMLTGGATIYYTTSFGECTHNYDDGVVTAPSCTEEGYTTYTCSACGNTYTDNTVDAVGHTYTEEITKEKTCTEVGEKTYTCQACGDTYSEVIPAFGHDYDESGVCSVCGEKDSYGKRIRFEFGENGSATHSDGSETISYTETVGNYTLSLTDGTKMYKNARDAKGNSCIKFGTGSAAGTCTFTVPDDITSVIICIAGYKANAAKITVNGISHTINSVSNNGEYEEIEVDTSSNKTVSFETVSGGYRAMVNTIIFVAAKIDSASITLGEDIAVNYYVRMSNMFKTAKMKFKVDGMTEIVEKIGEKQTDGRYKFSLSLAPQFMASNISAELIFDEEVIASKATYSIKEYAQNKLNAADSNDALKLLVSDLLRYGAAAQNYKNFNVDNLATKDITNLIDAKYTEVSEENNVFKLEGNADEVGS